MKLFRSIIFLLFAMASVMSGVVESAKPILWGISRANDQVRHHVVDIGPGNAREATKMQFAKMIRGGANTNAATLKDTSEADNGWNDLIAPSIYAGFTGILIHIIYQLRDAVTTRTLGSTALAFVTGALIWDNMIISLGSLLFRDAATNPAKYKILKLLSFPRFTLHAVGVPFQFITIAEMGKFAGVGFLQNNLVQMAVVAAAFVVVSRLRTSISQNDTIYIDYSHTVFRYILLVRPFSIAKSFSKAPGSLWTPTKGLPSTPWNAISSSLPTSSSILPTLFP